MDKARTEDLHALTAASQMARMRWKWRLQHLGWAVIGLLVLAGAVGLFGSGPLSSTTRAANELTLEYDRFIRRGTPFTLKATIPVPPGSTRAELSLPRDYLGSLRVLSIVPEPIQVVSGAELTKFLFAADPASDLLVVDLHAEPIKAGMLDAELIAGGARLQFTQFVWP